jgi:hypothetical protein
MMKKAIVGRYRDRGRKNSRKGPLLAEQIRRDPIGQGVEAEVGDPEHAPGCLQHMAPGLVYAGLDALVLPSGVTPVSLDKSFIPR